MTCPTEQPMPSGETAGWKLGLCSWLKLRQEFHWGRVLQCQREEVTMGTPCFNNLYQERSKALGDKGDFPIQEIIGGAHSPFHHLRHQGQDPFSPKVIYAPLMLQPAVQNCLCTTLLQFLRHLGTNWWVPQKYASIKTWCFRFQHKVSITCPTEFLKTKHLGPFDHHPL